MTITEGENPQPRLVTQQFLLPQQIGTESALLSFNRSFPLPITRQQGPELLKLLHLRQELVPWDGGKKNTFY